MGYIAAMTPYKIRDVTWQQWVAERKSYEEMILADRRNINKKRVVEA